MASTELQANMIEGEVIIGGDVTPYTPMLIAAEPQRPVSSRGDG